MEAGDPGVFPLPAGKRKQAEHGGAPGQGFADFLHKLQSLRPGQQVLVGRVPAFIDPLLDMGEQIRGVLSFVEYDRKRARCKEGTGSSLAAARTTGGSRET